MGAPYIRVCLQLISVLLLCYGYCQASPSPITQNGTISCKEHDVRHFQYNSLSELWGEKGGSIEISTSLEVHCLGVDTEVPNSLKYLVVITNLNAKPLKHVELKQPALRRSKRGIMQWFRDTWEKVKTFFRTTFNMGSGESEKQVEAVTLPTLTTPPPTTTELYREAPDFDPSLYKGMYDTAFEFVQFPNGTIPEVRLAANDTDESALGFKRHIADIFATQLDPTLNFVEEETPIGKHKTRYAYETVPNTENKVTTTPTSEQDSGDLKITRKVSSEDLLKLATAEEHVEKGFNDIHNLDLETVQVQQYSDGELVSADGVLNLSVNDIDSNKVRRRRRRQAVKSEAGVEVRTTFSIKLSKRRKRDITEDKLALDLEKELNFKRGPLMPTPSTSKLDTFAQERLTTVMIEIKKYSLSFSAMVDPKNTYLVSLVIELLELERNLKMKPSQISLNMKEFFPEKEVNGLCGGAVINRYACSVSLMVTASAGGEDNQNILLSTMKLWKKNENQALGAQLGQSLGLVPDPSSKWLSSIVAMTIEGINSNEAGVAYIIQSLSKLFKSSSLIREDKISLPRGLMETLKKRTVECVTDTITLAMLETIAGTGLENEELINVSKGCPIEEYEVSLIKGFRSNLGSDVVMDWLLNVLDNPSCHIRFTLAKVLLSEVKRKELTGDTGWPENGFNVIDQKLKELLLKDEAKSCATEPIRNYFRHKNSEKAGMALLEVDKFRGVTSKRRKRDAVWDDESCDDWKSHSKDTNDPIDGFEQDGKIYNRWRHCNTLQNYGRRKLAWVTYNGGMFAGIKHPSDPPEYKLQTEIKGSAMFMGKKFDVAEVSFDVDENNTKAYVELLGRTLFDLSGGDCSEDEFDFRPAQQIPIYSINLWLVQVNLGIHLGVDATMKFSCLSGKNDYLFNPDTRFRVAGEASGKILMLKGGINLGGNFNYRLKSRLQPYPEACMSAKQIYDPMSVSIDTWFQYYNPFKLGWSDRYRWSPNFLEWSIGQRDERDWVKHYCALPSNRETEASER